MTPKITTLKPYIATLDTRQGSSAAIRRVVGRHLGRIRERIALRAGYQCEICGRVTGPTYGVVDHNQPLHLGGAENDENRQWICGTCHDKKTKQEQRDRGGGEMSRPNKRR